MNTPNIFAIHDRLLNNVFVFAAKQEKSNPFIVVNTDPSGHLLDKFNDEMKKFKLKFNREQSCSTVRYLPTNGLIIFGNNTNFDYETRMDYATLGSLVDRKITVYNLVTDYDSAVRRLKLYCKNNDIEVVKDPPCCKLNCPLLDLFNSKPEKKEEVTKVSVKVTITDVPEKKEKQEPAVVVGKVTIHSYWVKIGYNQYDIRLDRNGNELIILEDGTILYIEEDLFGRKYLTA